MEWCFVNWLIIYKGRFLFRTPMFQSTLPFAKREKYPLNQHFFLFQFQYIWITLFMMPLRLAYVLFCPNKHFCLLFLSPICCFFLWANYNYSFWQIIIFYQSIYHFDISMKNISMLFETLNFSWLASILLDGDYQRCYYLQTKHKAIKFTLKLNIIRLYSWRH